VLCLPAEWNSLKYPRTAGISGRLLLPVEQRRNRSFISIGETTSTNNYIHIIFIIIKIL
jgi:hypothetical protein